MRVAIGLKCWRRWVLKTFEPQMNTDKFKIENRC